MTSSTTSYPPPLSDAPSVGTLRELLDALASGAYEVPPVPPLPATTVPSARPQVRWQVEHVPSGVPVRLSVGDELGVAELRHLRDVLGARWWDGDEDLATAAATPPAVEEATAPASDAMTATGPSSLSWAAGAPVQASTPGVAVAGAVGAAIAAAVGTAARFLVGLP